MSEARTTRVLLVDTTRPIVEVARLLELLEDIDIVGEARTSRSRSVSLLAGVGGA
jgi:hypothetical protein